MSPSARKPLFSLCRVCIAVLTSVCVSATSYAQDSTVAPRPERKAATIESHIVRLSPENTTVEFIGTHVGDDPKPRLGGFRAFSGTIELNEDDTAIRKIAVQFEIDSIWTEFDNLTAHLKTADFFDVATFPRAAFSSESISGPDATGTVTVTGKLILHGVSSELSFDCQPTLANRTLNLQGKFTIDRTKFGMDKMTEGVEPEVTVEVTVGPSGPHGKSPVPSTTTPARKQGD